LLECLQINVLLSRLCGEPVGFTVLGIFVMDKNTILTVRYYHLRHSLAEVTYLPRLSVCLFVSRITKNTSVFS